MFNQIIQNHMPQHYRDDNGEFQSLLLAGQVET
jgi:hypothetical protein